MQISRISSVALLAIGWFGSLAMGDDEVEFTRIEEDWELVLLEPAPEQDSPQISTWMSPTESLDHEHFSADFNHAKRPDFTSGGFQTKAMNGESMISDRLSENGDNFNRNQETIRWTQRMELKEQSLRFCVVDGTSLSWGSFGGGGCTVQLNNPPVSNLNDYSATKSASWAGVSFGANRVEKFKLKTVRFYVDNDLFAEVDVNLNVELHNNLGNGGDDEDDAEDGEEPSNDD